MKSELEQLLELGEPLVFKGGLGVLREARRIALDDGRDFNALTGEVQQQYIDLARRRLNPPPIIGPALSSGDSNGGER